VVLGSKKILLQAVIFSSEIIYFVVSLVFVSRFSLQLDLDEDVLHLLTRQLCVVEVLFPMLSETYVCIFSHATMHDYMQIQSEFSAARRVPDTTMMHNPNSDLAWT
jgi:hypothetical protein